MPILYTTTELPLSTAFLGRCNTSLQRAPSTDSTDALYSVEFFWMQNVNILPCMRSTWINQFEQALSHLMLSVVALLSNIEKECTSQKIETRYIFCDIQYIILYYDTLLILTASIGEVSRWFVMQHKKCLVNQIRKNRGQVIFAWQIIDSVPRIKTFHQRVCVVNIFILLSYKNDLIWSMEWFLHT